MSTSEEPVEIMWQGKWLVGKRQGKWEFVGRARGMRAVAILAIDAGHVLLVEQMRVPLGKRSIELPAGLVGDHDDSDTFEEAARRELEEEAGYRCDTVELIGPFYPSPGMVSESFTLARATGLTRVSDGGGVDGEDITVHRVALTDIPAFVAAKRAEGYAIDGKLLLVLGPSLLG
ncbi:NUDIX hydrolase [Sphingomonas hengshuiensis]|uniref:GDP-mannose pyrophosphatase n=1 Tax=Sphingomonas hengshuiensis TaxID=1609977 RepID=A0A7U4JAL5_9SPHN|nr:NUDIX hydrolase [Sphingomonas hengshuiensis]AJP73281.1 NUDIX hydrolase [Sphingomonas hengshuiensis]